MVTLQHMVLPQVNSFKKDYLYFKVEAGNCVLHREMGHLKLFEGCSLSLDSFYNALSVNKWKKCDIQNLFLSVEGEGEVQISCVLQKKSLPDQVVIEKKIQLKNKQRSTLKLPDWESISQGRLYVIICALSNAVIRKVDYETDTTPKCIKLGIVITHFNRKNYVVPAIKRVNQFLRNDLEYKNISLIVVDNSQNLTKDETQGAILLSNRNLGGSGGFTRGLIWLKDNGYTHCLFMDDDASCEIESIRRTYVFFSLLKETGKKIAISGALIVENQPQRVHEKPGQFTPFSCAPVNGGMSLESRDSLLSIESEPIKKDLYGAWCFFAFKIEDISYMAFPFFVRGDDITFSLVNKLDIQTINGIACYIDDFAVKESPLTRYFGFRGLVATSFISGKLKLANFLKLYLNWYLGSLFSYNYISAKAISISLRDVLQGCEVFINDMDGTMARKKIKDLGDAERLTSIQEDCIYSNIQQESRIRRIFRTITLNGLFVPSFLMKNKIIYQDKGFRVVFRQVFRYKKICYVDNVSNTGYIVEHDKKQIVNGFFTCLYDICLILILYNKAKEKFKSAEIYMSKEFWLSQFQ